MTSTPYDRLGAGYTVTRHADPRIAAQILGALGPPGPTVNVGAGTGNYEPLDRRVVAVEPSPVMLRNRPAGLGPAIRGVAESLPFPDLSFAASMAVLTIHHWSDIPAGLRELRRVARDLVVVLTWDAAVFARFWMVKDYIPASLDLDQRMPVPQGIAGLLGNAAIEVVPVPADCRDGFYAAWWRRPEAYLDPTVRQNISGLARLPADLVDPAIHRLEQDLVSGAWSRRYGQLLELDEYDAGYRLVVARR